MKARRPKTYYTPQELETESSKQIQHIHRDFIRKINASDYPCLGAKSAVHTDQYRLGIYGEMGSRESTEALAKDLKKYIEETVVEDSQYMTMIAIFTDAAYSEIEFEKKLWTQLQALHNLERIFQPWDPEVSSDPEADDFSFSFNGSAFFVVGVHPQASRKARRFDYCAMAFNLHRQFEQLREKGLYEKMKNSIRDREISYDGGINPMLRDHGKGLEAPQYSGRMVGKDWKCPFRR
ncbi:YqcI/YcgG family protein [Sphingobacterium shayense]|uniref:guanitoxin biosynthesis heme-dependent pre-guanitoxin N-hydroxylase GntA n=1 Tax=Sphingobacterium shayense TaxID=626343 RepID=UPI00155389B4|nr:guanitoxin biosynthesis heme-dependent pre-guanitoxin N-hydroxylase GntA [Sphingobacterium shayense]NQD69281.1 YqcI/YcgG family protein [Sphingobacterium shayense]